MAAFGGSDGEDGGALFAGGSADAESGYAALRTEGDENGFVGCFGAAGAGVGQPCEDEIAFTVFFYGGAFGWGKGAL